MTGAEASFEQLDWVDIGMQLDAEGYALLPGCAKFFFHDTNLSSPPDSWPESLYPRLAVIANRWSRTLGLDTSCPAQFGEPLQGQFSVSRLEQDEHVPLHQYNDGDRVFPLQVVALLSEPGVDFEGGEFVMTEQRPRMQSRPVVVPLSLGDAAIITAAERPVEGAKGFYRVNLRHGISRILQGERNGFELTFVS